MTVVTWAHYKVVMYETGVCETSLKAALTPPLLLMSLGNDGAVCAFTVAGGLCGKRKQ